MICLSWRVAIPRRTFDTAGPEAEEAQPDCLFVHVEPLGAAEQHRQGKGVGLAVTIVQDPPECVPQVVGVALRHCAGNVEGAGLAVVPEELSVPLRLERQGSCVRDKVHKNESKHHFVLEAARAEEEVHGAVVGKQLSQQSLLRVACRNVAHRQGRHSGRQGPQRPGGALHPPCCCSRRPLALLSRWLIDRRGCWGQRPCLGKQGGSSRPRRHPH
mmetsp:Transcript_12290/g.33765  ORF Transcript_12290/g.33765 Transcript_12290/m.33765 type:complete len:215 (-) Transcript_12290:206-850(-)